MSAELTATIETIYIFASSITIGYNVICIIFRLSTFEDETINGLLVSLLGNAVFFYMTHLLHHNDYYSTEIVPTLNLVKTMILLLLIIGEGFLFKYIQTNIIGGKIYQTVDMTGKVFIITGSNTGIGFETAKELARMGATVVLACRSLERAKAAKEEIMKATKSIKIIVAKLDLCGFDSVRKFVKEFHSMKLPLHGLINNAGVMMEERQLTQDGFETVFTANHLSHFLLTNLLLQDLEKTGGRVIVLSSSLYKLCKAFDFDDIMSEKSYSLFSTYAKSKLANILFMLELQRRLLAARSKVTCNAVHPGAVRTEVTRHMHPIMQTLNKLFAPAMMLLQKTPLQGAYCSIYAAIDESLEGKGGMYLIDCQAYPLTRNATDALVAKELWEKSEILTGLKK